MTAFVRGICMLAILFSSIVVWAQSGSPQAALEEVATAENLETVLRHLPPSIERNIRQLSPQRRAGIEDELLIQKKMKAEGVELQRGSDGSTWELTGPNIVEGNMNDSPAPREKMLISIQNAIENGDDALLLLEARRDTSATADQAQPDLPKRESALVWMKFEDGEWRITEVGAVQRVKIEELLSKAGDGAYSSQAASEASAVGTLRTLNTAIVSYESAYPDVGLPPTIASLSYPADETCNEPSAEHACLVDSTFVASPLIRRGYEFQYTRISSNRYTITAQPVETDTSGNPRSFFTDESYVIRVTPENRAATAQDPPLQ